MENTILISVNTVQERSTTIKKLYKSLTKNPDRQFTIQQDRVNRIKIFHNKKSLQILIQTYIVVVLPVLLDFSPLEKVYGTVDYRLDKTIERLLRITHKLQAIQGRQVIKGNIGARELKDTLTNIF